MAAKFLLALSAQVLLVQIAVAQYPFDLSYGYGYPGSYIANNALVSNDVSINGGFLGPINVATSGVAQTAASYASGGVGVSLGAAAPFGSLGGLGSFGSLGLAAPASVSVAAPVGLGSGLVAGLPGLSLAAISPLSVTTISPFGPSGLALAAELELAGVLDVVGQAPFLSAVAFQGALPTAGSGVASCGCGNGQVGIIGSGPGSFPLSGFGPVIY